jgi:hypothetical protein
MAIYLVTGPDGKERLVDASTQAGARSHAARKDYKVTVASQADLFRIAKAGGDVEAAGADSTPEPEPAKPPG